jgi:hypothetical protein
MSGSQKVIELAITLVVDEGVYWPESIEEKANLAAGGEATEVDYAIEVLCESISAVYGMKCRAVAGRVIDEIPTIGSNTCYHDQQPQTERNTQ